MVSSYLPLAATLLVAVLTATTSSLFPVTAANKYSGRMVIIRAPGARLAIDVSAGGGGALVNKWQRRRRLVEDEVAPEFGSLLGAGNGGGYVSDDALDKDRAICQQNGQCAAHGPGGSNTRPCTYKDHSCLCLLDSHVTHQNSCGTQSVDEAVSRA